MTARFDGASSRRRLLDDAADLDDIAVDCHGFDAAVRRDLVGRHFFERDHRPAAALVDVEHRAQQRTVVDHDVVGEQHRERLVTDVMARDRDRVAEPERIALAHVVDVGELGRELHFLQQVVLAALLEVVLELEVAVEVVLDRALAAAGDDAGCR